uniref:PLAT domain-containing protein n=1 Tax=Panagrolaimus sp. ES5 TaxID=591445 RepID=A0AC34GV64_9BILA
MVETGYKVFASTTSNVFITLVGTEGKTEARKLDGDCYFEQKIKYGFARYRRERFLVCSEKPLGDLHFVKVWIDLEGKEALQSWYCDHISVKDLQTDKLYSFKIKSWFDTTAAKFFAVTKNWSIFSEAWRIQNLVENMPFLIPSSGGHGRFRHCFDRTMIGFECGWRLLCCVGLSCLISKITLFNQQNDPALQNYTLAYPKQSFIFQLACYKISLNDVLYGCLMGVYLTFYSMPYFFMHR